jgi:hypothetical protein
MTKQEFYSKWDEQTLYSQDACNPSGLLHSAGEMLRDWKNAGGNFQGNDCPHLKFLLYQIVFLVFGREMEWDGWHDEFQKIQERLKGGAS